MRREAVEDAVVRADGLSHWVSGDGRLLFMTDFDGALTPHGPDPAEARLGRV
jgi:trehalose-6-phosphatase